MTEEARRGDTPARCRDATENEEKIHELRAELSTSMDLWDFTRSTLAEQQTWDHLEAIVTQAFKNEKLPAGRPPVGHQSSLSN